MQIATSLLTTDLLSASQYQDVFAGLVIAFRQHVCGKFTTDLLQVDCQDLSSTSLLQVVPTSYNKSANDKLILKIDNLGQV